MINKALLLPYKSLSLGEQVHINHEGCIAGLDTKKRLYIKKVAGGVVGYCHHCNEPGFLRELSTDGKVLREWLYGKKDDSSFPRVTTASIEFLMPITNIFIMDWLRKHHIERPYDPKYYAENLRGDLGMHLYSWGNSIASYGLQTRSFTTGKSKYLTKVYRTNSTEGSWFTGSLDKLFITEDYTSAYRIWRDTGYTSFALLKTSISPSAIELIASINPKQIGVWLDPDMPGRIAGTKLTNRLSYALPTTVKNYSWDEPKSFSPRSLKEICCVD